MTIEKLTNECEKYTTKKELELITRAFDYAQKAHAGQLRKSGESYIQHPLHVAMTLAKMRLDGATISAALLHDVCEDTPITLQEIEKEFGKVIAFLVDSISKLSKVRVRKDITAEAPDQNEPDSFHSFPRQFETLQKMFVAMAQDIRVILVKLADRLHNMETLSYVAPEKQLRIARETLEIYAPMADRLGIGELKGQLEDLAFPYVHPDEYQKLKKIAKHDYPKRLRHIKNVQKAIESELKKNHIDGEVNGRVKHLYSLHNKMKRLDLDQIYDKVALRIIVDSVRDCYAVLGIIHKLWKPLTGRIKDYISMPKPNGYQSIHTTVFCLDGQPTEIQIRTRQMHEQAEFGIASHWHFKTLQTNPSFTKNPDEIAWVRQLAELQNKLTDPGELTEGLKLDFFQNRIFVFTPRGDVHDLPTKATPIDFAFAVHSDLGYHCYGAKVNGKMVTLSHPLQNGDIVEIIPNKKSSPKSDWLNFIKTSEARSNIRQALKAKEASDYNLTRKHK
ncbi:MAG: RelA/SpoT family protein [bacterium]|nr:RelA/SpoT family protein [bacterium]